MRILSLLLPALLMALPARAAINPAEFQRAAPEQLRLHERARVVDERVVAGARLRRVTIVADVVAVQRSAGLAAGDVIVIDYSVDLDAREHAGQRHGRENGTRPGPQFMFEPDPPATDARGEFTAHLAPRGAGPRHAGAVEGDADVSGPVYAPASGQYSFPDASD